MNIALKATRTQLVIICSFAIMFISKVLVISGNYNIPIDPVFIQIVYLGIVIFYGVFGTKKIRISKNIEASTVVALALIVYIVLFGCVFINPLMSKYTYLVLQRQSMFVAIVVLSAWVIKKYNLFDAFLKVIFISLSMVLFYQFIFNLSDLKFLLIANIMNNLERTRGNFGFGHYNTLGGVCVCNIIISLLIKKRKCGSIYLSWMIYPFILLSSIMLLVSASRSSITGLGIYICLYIFLNLKSRKLSKKASNFIKVLLIFFVILLITFNFSVNLLFNSFLEESNRSHLFNVALPTFFKSGRTMIGLGLAPTELYGLNQTPYRTYWLDNGYIYTLVTTGYIGCLIYGVALDAIAKKMYKLSKCEIGTNMICIFVVYLYTALFEATLFTGVIQNYAYVIIFLIYTSDYFTNLKDDDTSNLVKQ